MVPEGKSVPFSPPLPSLSLRSDVANLSSPASARRSSPACWRLTCWSTCQHVKAGGGPPVRATGCVCPSPPPQACVWPFTWPPLKAGSSPCSSWSPPTTTATAWTTSPRSSPLRSLNDCVNAVSLFWLVHLITHSWENTFKYFFNSSSKRWLFFFPSEFWTFNLTEA